MVSVRRRPAFMFRITKLGLLLAVLSALTACGGSSGSSGGTGVTVLPSGVQVLAGASQQMTATAADGGTTFTWQVNGIAGGNSTLGTISTTGLYTAPNLPPAGGKVTITATEQGNSGASGSATLSLGFSNVSLSGANALSLSGRNQGAPWFAIGEFNANGSGQISGGLLDTNNGTVIQSKFPFTGSYTVNPDGTGNITLGTLNFQLVLQADGSAFLLSTTNGTILTGSTSAQDPSAGNVASFTAPLVLSAGGQSGNQGFSQLALVNTSGGGNISGYEDVSGSKPLIRIAWSGSYTFDGNDHGTLTIMDSNGNHAYSFYVVSAEDYVLLSTDPAVTASGNINSQTAVTYSNNSLTEPYVFLISGNSATQGFAQAGQFNPNGLGNLNNVTEDINIPGNLQTDLTTSGTYSFDATVNGRGTFMLNGQGASAPQNYTFYMLSPQLAEFMTAGSSFVGGGYIVMQTQGSSFSNASLSGAYGLALGAQTGSASMSASVGTLDLDGNGSLSGSMIQNLNGSVSSALSLSGSYMLSGGVRGTAMLTSSGGGSSPFAIYPVNPSVFLLIGTNSASPYFGIATNQN